MNEIEKAAIGNKELLSVDFMEFLYDEEPSNIIDMALT
jgi:hypothetical protein